MQLRIEIPPKLGAVFEPKRGDVRYRCAYGGRGSGKSYSFALMAAVWGYAEPLRILATREFQNSIKESFYAEAKAAIEAHEFLSSHYVVGESFIRGRNGTEFIFRGLRHNIAAIKSTAQIDLCIVEEAETVPESSWLNLLPTVRAPKSEIWVIWNPERKGSPVDKRFRGVADSDIITAALNYCDNPWLPEVLEKERVRDRATLSPEVYAWVWEGEYLENSEAQVFAGRWRVAEFEPDPTSWDGPYHGLDFGFAQDPTASVRCWIHGDVLYIDAEAVQVGLELDATADYLAQRIDSIRSHPLRADCARPESISYLKRHGLPRIAPVAKWSGSVEDGINRMRAFRGIVVAPNCKHTISEMKLYSYKKDRLTGDVLPTLVDANNHCIDALRYALAPIIKQRGVDYGRLNVQ